MSRDATLDDRQPWNPSWESDDPDQALLPSEDRGIPAEPSALDRVIVLPAETWRWIALSVTLAVAFLLRFVGLDRWPLSITGATVAQTAQQLVRGESPPDHLLGVPFTVEWTALFLFAGGPADSVARVAHATAGIVAVVLMLALSRWIGTRTAVAAAAIAAVSPTLIAVSRRVDGGALLVALSVIIIAAALRSRTTNQIAWGATGGAATALLILSHPIGLVAAPLAWLAFFLLRNDDSDPINRDVLLAGALGGIAAYVLASTALLTQPGSLAAATGELLARFTDDHLTEVGHQFHRPIFNLIINEPLLILFAVVGVVASTRRTLVRALAIWFVVSLVVILLFAGDTPAGYSLVVLPLVVLAAVGVVHLMERLPWSRFRTGPALVYLIAVLLMAAAVVSLIGLVSHGVGDDTLEWLLRFTLIVLVAILPLSLVITSIGHRVAGDRLVIVLAAAVVLLAGLGVRTAVLTASDWAHDPGHLLSTDSTAASVPIIVERVERLSRDLTMGVRDAQDITGGHGLRIALDEEIEQPFRWYFRNFPNLTIFDPDSEVAPLDTQLMLLDGDRDINSVAPGYSGQTYLYSRGQPEIYDSPDWGGILTGVVNPDAWGRFVDFLISREAAAAPPEREFQLAAAPDIAGRLFPAQGPFGLQDRSGPGNAQGQMNRPRGVAVGPDGSTYVVDSRNARIQKYAPTGEFLLAFGGEGSAPGQLGRIDAAGGGGPSGITFGSDGNLYVADTWNHRIQVFSPEGEYLRSWGQFFDAQDSPDPGTSPSTFYGPRGIAASDGLIFVTDTGNERVQVFQEDGTFVRAFGGTGTEDERLLEPVGIAIGTDGTVYVADSHNTRIARFTADGAWLEPWRIEQWEGLQFFEPYLALAPDGTLYATTSVNGTVLPIDASGSAGAALGEGLLRQPFGVTVDPSGAALLVTDGSLHAVVRVPIQP